MSTDDSTPDADDPTALPEEAAAEGGPAARELFERIYTHLHAAAQRQMHGERAGHTLSATALVHEAYLRLGGGARADWQGEAHFYAAAARAMRHVLIDHARARGVVRRGGPDARRAALLLSELPDPASEKELAGFLILDEAIARLEGADPQAASVVRLRYFSGLSIRETAHALGISEPTVKRAWVFARAWLKDAIERES